MLLEGLLRSKSVYATTIPKLPPNELVATAVSLSPWQRQFVGFQPTCWRLGLNNTNNSTNSVDTIGGVWVPAQWQQQQQQQQELLQCTAAGVTTPMADSLGQLGHTYIAMELETKQQQQQQQQQRNQHQLHELQQELLHLKQQFERQQQDGLQVQQQLQQVCSHGKAQEPQLVPQSTGNESAKLEGQAMDIDHMPAQSEPLMANPAAEAMQQRQSAAQNEPPQQQHQRQQALRRKRRQQQQEVLRQQEGESTDVTPEGDAECSRDAKRLPDDAGQGAAAASEQKPGKARPTHFLALQVSHSQQVQAAIASVQAQLVESAPHLKACLLEPPTAHLTIMVLHMSGQEEAAAAALAELGPVLQSQQLLAPLQLQLQGLSHFRHQVLYLDVAEGDAKQALLRLGAAVIKHFSNAAGGTLAIDEGGRGFTPHVTVAKTSRLIGKRRKGAHKGRVMIPEEAWAAAAGLEAGSVSINEIQICSMQGRRAGQYYRVTHRLELAPPLAEAAAQRAAAEAAVPATPTPPLAGPAGPAVTPAAEQAAAQQAAVPAERQGPIAAARKRFKRLLSALVCGGHQGGTTDGHSAGCNH